jgi:hypothetical protein
MNRRDAIYAAVGDSDNEEEAIATLIAGGVLVK